MNARFLGLLPCFALVASLTSVATASPIQYTVYVTGAPNLPQYSFNLDLAQGGISPGFEHRSPIPGIYLSLEKTLNSLPLDGTASVRIESNDPQDPTLDRMIDVSVPFSGSVGGDGMTYDLGGFLQGTGVSATADGLPTSTLPAPMLDLLKHPERVSLLVSVGGSPGNSLFTQLMIAPDVGTVPAPEPSTVVTLLVGILGLAWRRSATGRRRRGADAN